LNFIHYDWLAQFTNFYRNNSGYDSVSDTFNVIESIHQDTNANYHDGDIIRTGRRMILEPRLTLTIPVSSGFQLQPSIKAGTMIYHFDFPTSTFADREYVNVEVPFSLYLTKNFHTNIQGYEKIRHIIQPRVIYASSLVQRGNDNHPFFQSTSQGLTNPGFDILEQFTPFEYFRFEFINRFLRFNGSNSEKFFLLQLSEQYNSKISPSSIDPRFIRRLGPIEILSEFHLWDIYAQAQGNYQLESSASNGGTTREHDISASLEYRTITGDRISLGNRLRIQADDSLTEKTAMFSFYKTLPFFFDIEGGMEYSYKRGDLLGARFGINFGSKPRSCWGAGFTFGQDDLKRKFVKLIFRIDFGSQSLNQNLAEVGK
jgi:hypothetical protein